MSEFISVPRTFVEQHLHNAAFPARVHVYGSIKYEYVNTTFSTYGFSGFSFSCTYMQLPRNCYDMLMGRTRYELVNVYNEILGAQGTQNISHTKRKELMDLEKLNHLDIRYRNYRTWNK